MLLSEAEDAAGVWASHPWLKIRVTRVRRPWWLGGIGAGILLSAVGCDVDAGICLMVWLSAKFWVFKNDDQVMRRSRNCNVDAYKMVQHKVKRIVGRCNLMFKGSNIGQDGRALPLAMSLMMEGCKKDLNADCKFKS